MKTCRVYAIAASVLGLALVVAVAVGQRALAASGSADQGGLQLIQPSELVKLLPAPASRRPVIIQVGFRTLYEQAHIPGSEYVGAASQAPGRAELHKRVQGLSRKRMIVLYCGCCPWSHCPNVHPAYKELRDMGFTNVKVLYVASNFGADWVDKGYPVSKGQ